VPRGFDVLMPLLERDESLAEALFGSARPGVLRGGGAAAAPVDAARRAGSQGPWAAGVHGVGVGGDRDVAADHDGALPDISHAGIIGLPAPGCELKLVPREGKLEMRVRGPNITPGYVQQPEQTRAAFDEDGWYRTGDAGRLADPADPRKGIVFDGRVAEDFKLTSGTWVNVGAVRVAAIAAGSPVLQDAVVAGEGQAEVGLLGFPSLAGCRALAGLPEATLAELVNVPAVREALVRGLQGHNAEAGSSSRCVARVLLLIEPPALDAGEITDKGYINQRAVLTRRADAVARLYAEPMDPAVHVIGRG
jgi:feruloyl-CoA synthase